MSKDWRSAYRRCLNTTVTPEALTRLGQAIGNGSPSQEWNAGQEVLADILFTLTAALVDLYPPDGAAFNALADEPDDGLVVGRWAGGLFKLWSFFDPVQAEEARQRLIKALEGPPLHAADRAPEDKP